MLAGGSSDEEEEEEYLSSSSSSSSDDDEDEGGGDAGTHEPDSAAKARALEEARAMLADAPRAKKKGGNAYFEDEVIIAA